MDIINRAGIFYTLIVLFLVPFELFLAYLVYSRDKTNSRNLLFLGLDLAMVIFLITNYLGDGLSSAQIALWDLRLYFLSTSLIITFTFLFTFVFPKELKIPRWFRYFIYGYGAITSILSLTPLLASSVTIEDWGSNVIGGPLFLPYNLITLVMMILFFIILFISYRRNRGTARRQLFYLFTGFFLFFIVNLIVNVIAPIVTGTNQLARYGSYASAFFVAFTAYAIVAEHIFDIRVIVKRTLIFSGLLVFATVTYSMIIFAATALLGGSGSAFEARSFITNLVAAGLIAVGFEPIRKWLAQKTDSFLFKKEYEEKIVLKDLAHKLNDVVALDEGLEILMQTMVKVLHLDHAATFVFQQGENGQAAIKRIKQIGYSSTTPLFLTDKDFTIQYFNSNPSIITVRKLKAEVEKEKRKFNYIGKNAGNKNLPPETSQLIRAHAIKQSVVKKLDSLAVAMAIPLQLNSQPLGLILLSNKLSGDEYSSEDISFLETIGAQAISSIQKAKLYEGDQMKSEFVSIASHELLTPISAMEGYLSMILDENIGKVDDQARGYLEKVFSSSKRLSVLIKDLLSVSRIEAGRMKIEPQQLDMTKMIGDTMDQLKFIAAEKNIKLTYPDPKPLPPVWADPDRTTQILVNLVSNAIKYTPQGSVTIATSVGEQPMPHVKVEVSDTGLGMTKEAQSHLFEKFYRISTPETTGIIGTGLGLYITKSLVERMGGSMNVISKPGKGSTFSFNLPLFQVESSEVK